MTMTPRVTVIASALFGLMHCAPQTKGASTVTVHNKESGAVATSGAQVGIDDGSSILVPAGALAVGVDLTVQKVGEPAEFSAAAAPAASSTVQVAATNTDGSAVIQAAAPMTVSLIVGTGASLDLTATATADNLCVLLKANQSVGTKLLVFRKAAISYDASTKKAMVQTLFFGMFQLVYCGSDPLSGFEDAALSGATGEAKLTATMMIPAGYDGDLGSGKACLIVARHDNDVQAACQKTGISNCPDQMLALGVADLALQSGTDTTIKAQFLGSQLVSGKDHFVMVALFDATQVCPVKVGDNVAGVNATIGLKSSYGFKVDIATLKAGVTGRLGDAGVYGVTTTALALGGPGNFASFPRFNAPLVCMESGSNSGQTSRTVDFSASTGDISGGATFNMPLASGASGSSAGANVTASVGVNCDVNTATLKPDPKTGIPYKVTFYSAGPQLALTPVTIHVTNTNPLAATYNGCLVIGSPGAFDSGSPDRIGHTLLALADGGTFQLYLPFLGDSSSQAPMTPTYDMQLTVLDGGGDCDTPKSTLPAQIINGMFLTQDIQIKI